MKKALSNNVKIQLIIVRVLEISTKILKEKKMILYSVLFCPCKYCFLDMWCKYDIVNENCNGNC